tara:strand:- start:1386 stop:2393 length:1008 start_codon:yes stop_codon:yes gene_type:complete
VAVLRINGHTVPVELDTLRVETVEVGATNKAYDGSTLNLRYGFKRRISFTTTPLSEMEAFALEGLVHGQGEYWSFDGNSTVEYLYSSRGTGPLSSTGNAQEGSSVKFSKSLDPGTTLLYPSNVVTGLTDLTVSAWVSDATSSPSGDKYIFYSDQGGNTVALSRGNGANNVNFTTVNSAGTHSLTKTTAWTGVGNFHMITAVLRINPETGENCKELYYNGSSAASESNTTTSRIPDLSSSSFDVGVGNDGDGGGQFPGYIDDLIIVPYAATSDIVSAWYAMGKAMSPLPKVYVDGDVIPDDTLTSLFFGSVRGSNYLLYAASSNNKRKLSITLEEV